MISDLLYHLEGKKNVIWDWNGTLLDDIEHSVSTIDSIANSEGIGKIHLADYREHFGFPVIKYYEKVGFDTSSENFKRLSDIFVERYQSGVDSCVLHAGVKETLLAIKKMGFTQSVLSALVQEKLEFQLAQYGIREHFDFVFGLDNHYAHGKTQRGQELMKMAGFVPAETVLVGDTLHDAEVAEALGITPILVADGHCSVERLRQTGYPVLRISSET